MPVTRVTKTTIKEQLDKRLRNVMKAVDYVVGVAGEKAVNEQRAGGGRDYQDQTGNLRSSIGYVKRYNGAEKASDFKAVKDSQEGSEKGEKFAKEIASETDAEISLTIVAGMEYAGYVSAKGYDVLDTASETAHKEVNKGLQKLQQLISKQ